VCCWQCDYQAILSADPWSDDVPVPTRLAHRRRITPLLHRQHHVEPRGQHVVRAGDLHREFGVEESVRAVRLGRDGNPRRNFDAKFPCLKRLRRREYKWLVLLTAKGAFCLT
jgi:hypothetical protein